ncbi:MAG: hypothetical protein R3C17_07875 [Planctomycetaceae bacterium]
MKSYVAEYMQLVTFSLVILTMTTMTPTRGEEAAVPADAQSLADSERAVAPQGPVRKTDLESASREVIPFAREAYRVVVEIGFDGRATQNPVLRKKLTDEIRKGLDRMYGAAWNAHVHESEWLIPGGPERLRRLTANELAVRYPESIAQKVMLMGVGENAGVFQITCCEYDTRVEEISPVLTETTNNEAVVAHAACRLVRDSFRPVLLFSRPSVVSGELEFLLQGGELAVPDSTAAFIQDGDVLRPFLRQMDRRNPDRLVSLLRLDLCYVRVTGYNTELRADAETPDDLPVSVEGRTRDTSAVYRDSGHVRGVLLSHGPVPFGGARRSVQQIALRQRPAAQTSRVKLVLQVRPDRPLICHRVDKISKLRHTDRNAAPAVRLLSDRNGEIEIAADPENPTYWLYVYSGSSLLARVPYAPGIIPEDTIRLPDDSLRLGVEGELYLFRDALVDTVAQKAVLKSLAKKASTEGKPDDLDKLIVQLDKLPGQKEFMSRLNSIKTPAVQKAESQRNLGAKRRIEKLCLAMEESLTAFYSSENKLREAEELEKLRSAATIQSTAVNAPGLVPAE